MKKSEKVILVENLTARLNAAHSIILADITGLRVNEQNKLRRTLTEAGAKLVVVKNTLLERAFNQISNFKFLMSNLKPSLTGQTAVIISETNEIEPAQALGKFIKELEMPKLKVGIISGSIYDESALIRVSKLPGREALVGQLLGVLNGPAYGMIGTLQGKMQELVYLLKLRSVGQ